MLKLPIHATGFAPVDADGLHAFIDRLVAELQSVKIVLFGSYP